MLMRRIIGVAGISLWAGLIGAAVIAGLEGDNFGLAKKAMYDLGIEPTTIEALAEDLVNALANGDFKETAENFDGTMKKELPAEKLQKVWNSLITHSGPFVEQLGTRREKMLQYDVISVTCKFENAVLDTKVVFDHKKQIAGLFFVPSRGSAK